MTNSISINDFTFKFSGYGHYKVTYQSPVTGKEWSRTINDMQIIDNTKNEEEPKKNKLKELRRMCKR